MRNADFQFDRFIFVGLESAEKFRSAVREKGYSSTISSPSGGAYSYGVRVFDKQGNTIAGISILNGDQLPYRAGPLSERLPYR